MIHATGLRIEFTPLMLVLRVVAGDAVPARLQQRCSAAGRSRGPPAGSRVWAKPGRLNAWMAASTEMGAGCC